MAEISDDALRALTDKIRDLRNVVAVFTTEYDLPEEVTDTISEKLEDLARTLGTQTL